MQRIFLPLVLYFFSPLFFLFQRVKFANLIKLANAKQPWRIFQIKIQDRVPLSRHYEKNASFTC